MRLTHGLLILSLLLPMLSACVPGYPAGIYGESMQPRPLSLSDIPADNDSFAVGWRHGCQSYVGVIGDGFLKLQPYAFDAARAMKDETYYKGFRAGVDHCTYFTDWDPT